MKVADELLGWDSCFASFYSEDENKLYTICLIDIINGERKEAPPAPGGTEPTPITAQTLAKGAQLILREETKRNEAVSLVPFGNETKKSASLMFVPIRNKERNVGILSIQSYTINAYDNNDLELLQVLADFGGGAIERSFKQAEQIRKNEEFLRLLSYQMPIILWTTDRELRFTLSVGVGLEKINLKPNQVVGMTLFEYYQTNDPTFPIIAMHKRAIQGESISGEIEWKGRLFYTYVEPIYDTEGEVRGCIGLGYDVTERKMAEKELNKFKMAIEQTGDMVIISDKNDKIEYVNTAFEIMTGYSKDEVIGKTPHLLHSGKHNDEFYANILKTLLSGSIFRGMIIDKKKNEDLFYQEITASPLKDEQGNILHFVTTGKNITESVRSEIETKAKMRHISTIHEAARLAMEANQPQKLARSILDLLSQVMSVDAFAFVDYDLATDNLMEILQADTIDGEFKIWETNITHSAKDDALLDRVRNGEPIIELRKPGEKVETDLTPFGDKNHRSASLLIAPIPFKRETKGIITIQSYKYNAYDHNDLEIFADIANVVGVALSRMKAEETLRKSEEIYRRAISFAQGVPYQRDYRLNAYTFIGEGIKEVTGYASEEFTTELLDKIIQERVLRGELAGLSSEEAAQLARAGKVRKWQADYRILTRDGQTRWLSDYAIPLKASKGMPLGAIGILQDITDRKRAEEELKYVHQIYRKAIENAEGVTYRLDYSKNGYLYIDEGIEKLYGVPAHKFSRSLLASMSREIIMTDPEAPGTFNEYVKSFKEGKINRYRADLRIMTPQGEEKWISDCSVPIRDDKTGQVIGSLGILQDITFRKRAEEALKRRAEIMARYQSAIVQFATQEFSTLTEALKNITEISAKTLEVERVSVWFFNQAWTESTCYDNIRI